jgi:hypothetical protein
MVVAHIEQTHLSTSYRLRINYSFKNWIVMTSPSCILLYGRVPLLLDTRLMVLETRDLRVLTATDVDEVERMITTCDIDLVIFAIPSRQRRGEFHSQRCML